MFLLITKFGISFVTFGSNDQQLPTAVSISVYIDILAWARVS